MRSGAFSCGYFGLLRASAFMESSNVYLISVSAIVKAARLVSFAKGRDHITPILRKLHLLHIRKRIACNIFLLTFKAIKSLAPNCPQVLVTRCKTPPMFTKQFFTRTNALEDKNSYTFGEGAFGIKSFF